MKKIAFFDLNIVGIGRYPLQIANEINKDCKNCYFYFLYEEDPDHKIEEIKNKLPKNSEIIKIEKANYGYIKKLFQKIDPESFLVMAQRIPDNALVSVANELNIKTFKFQHGLYIPFMKRESSIFIKKLFKTIRYIKYSLVVANATKYPKLKMLKEYINIFVKGKKITNTDFPLEKINAKKVFVYGEYWKEYHNKEYGYSYDQQIVVGYPDLVKLDEIKKYLQEDAICYICQTLVEDGRLPREEMEKFIKILAENIKDKKLYIKLHPRSDISLYKPLQNKDNVIFVRNDFPNCTKYIGHYSSMIAIAMYLTNEIFLWKFENHNTYPFYFVENIKIISNSVIKLREFINEISIYFDLYNKNKIEKYFQYNINYLSLIKKFLTI